jgi:hypothetical protein
MKWDTFRSHGRKYIWHKGHWKETDESCRLNCGNYRRKKLGSHEWEKFKDYYICSNCGIIGLYFYIGGRWRIVSRVDRDLGCDEVIIKGIIE